MLTCWSFVAQIGGRSGFPFFEGAILWSAEQASKIGMAATDFGAILCSRDLATTVLCQTGLPKKLETV